MQDFGMIGNGTFRQCFQPVKNLAAVVQVAAGQHTDHDWMAKDLVILKQRPEAFVSDPHVIYPPGGIDQDHGLPECRRIAIFLLIRLSC